jgi:murein DD-endopeptidase MepM/ murein hydrolase activator NlpD
MKKILTAILSFYSICGFCQIPGQLSKIDTLSNKYNTIQLTIDSLENVLESLEERDDSLFNSIFTGTIKTISSSIDTFNYERIFDDYQKFLSYYGAYLKSSDFPRTFPIENVQKKTIIGFGNRLHPIYKTVKFHYGIDIPSKKGNVVIATTNGKILLAKISFGIQGNQVVIQNDNGVEVMYSHLDSIYVKQGETVMLGQSIGIVGNSGLSVESHLHYEIKIDNLSINPIFILFNQFSKDDLEYIFTKNSMSLD